MACIGGHAECCELLIPVVDIEAKDKDGVTSLGYTCMKGHIRCLEILLHAGADLSGEHSPLKLAKSAGKQEILDTIMAYIQNPNEYQTGKRHGTSCTSAPSSSTPTKSHRSSNSPVCEYFNLANRFLHSLHLPGK